MLTGFPFLLGLTAFILAGAVLFGVAPLAGVTMLTALAACGAIGFAVVATIGVVVLLRALEAKRESLSSRALRFP